MILYLLRNQSQIVQFLKNHLLVELIMMFEGIFCLIFTERHKIDLGKQQYEKIKTTSYCSSIS